MVASETFRAVDAVSTSRAPRLETNSKIRLIRSFLLISPAYLIEPAVRPLINHFSIAMNRITTGMMAISEVANT